MACGGKKKKNGKCYRLSCSADVDVNFWLTGTLFKIKLKENREQRLMDRSQNERRTNSEVSTP